MTSDVVVIGGGVIGCTIAYALAAARFTVTVVERDEIGGQAAVVNTGMLGPYTEIKHPPAFAAFAERSFAKWPSLAQGLHEETGIDIEFVRPGLLQLALSEDECAALQDAGRHLPPAAAAQWVDGPALRELEPELAPEVLGALYLPTEAHVHNLRLMRALILAGQRNGVRFVVGAPVQTLRLEAGGAVAALAGEERIVAARAVLAAGAWSGALAATLGLRLPTVPVRGQLVYARGERRPFERIFYASGGYGITKRDGTVVLGGTVERAGYRASPTVGGVQHILARTTAAVPNLAAFTVLGAVAGLRPHLPDDLPAIGRIPGAEQVIVATGHFRNGILLAPATADAVVELIEGRATPPGLTVFDPARFQRASA
jgi:glycine oxidase